MQRRIEECLGGGLTYCKQGQSPCSKHEVPSGGGGGGVAMGGGCPPSDNGKQINVENV